jgi:hypothetical protein
MMNADKPAGPIEARHTRTVLAAVVEERGEMRTPLADAIRAGNILAPFTLRRINTSGLAPGDYRTAEDYNPQGDTPIWLADYIRKAGSTSIDGRKGSFLLEESFGTSHLADLGRRFQQLASPTSPRLSREERADFLGYFASRRNALIQARLYTGALTALAQMPVDFMRGLDPTSTSKDRGVPPSYKKLLTDYAAFRFAGEFEGKTPPDNLLHRAHSSLCADADELQMMLQQSPKGQQYILDALRQQGEVLDHKLRLLDPEAHDSCAARLAKLADFETQVSPKNKDDYAKACNFPSFNLFSEVNAKRGDAHPPRYYYPKTDEKGHILINDQGQPIFYSAESPSFGSMIPSILDKVAEANDPVSFVVDLFTHTVHAIRISQGMVPHELGNTAALTEEELARGAVASLVASSGMEGHGSPGRVNTKDVLKQADEIHAQQQEENRKKYGRRNGKGYSDDDNLGGPTPDKTPPPSSPPSSPASDPPPAPADDVYYEEQDPFLYEKEAKPPSKNPPHTQGVKEYTLKTGPDAPKYIPLDKGDKKTNPDKDHLRPPPFQPGHN